MSVIENIQEILAGDKSEEKGRDLARTLCNYCNTFGSYKKLIADVNKSLDREGKRIFETAMCLAAMSLATRYKEDGWIDDRNQASKKFAAKNKEWFETQLACNLGFVPNVNLSDIERYQNYRHALSNAQFREDSWCLGFLEKWDNEHPTLQQAAFGGYVTGVLVDEDDFIGNYPNGEIIFPFI